MPLYVSFSSRMNSSTPQCLKITEKVSFNIASKASYVYILSGQKLLKNAKNGAFWWVFWKLEACGQTVLPDRSVLIGQKLVENAKIQNLKCDILSNFQTMWYVRRGGVLRPKQQPCVCQFQSSLCIDDLT